MKKLWLAGKKVGPPKKPLLFWSCNQGINAVSHLGAKHSTRCDGPAWRITCKQNSFYVGVVYDRHRA